MRLAIDCHLTFLHHLKEGGLRLRWCTIDFVHQHDVCKDRTGMEIKVGALHVEHIRAQYIARHQVRRELHTAELCIDKLSQQASQQGLCHTGYTFEQHMSISQYGGKQQVDVFRLSYDDL